MIVNLELVLDAPHELAYDSHMYTNLAPAPLRTWTVEQLRGMYRAEGMILRADDGTRAVCIRWNTWRLEAAGYRLDMTNPHTHGRWWWLPDNSYKVEEWEAVARLDAAEKGTK